MRHFWTALALLILLSVIVTAAGLWYLSSSAEFSRNNIETPAPKSPN